MLFLCWRSWAERDRAQWFIFLMSLWTASALTLGIHTDVEVHNDICLTGSLTAFIEVRPRAEASGTGRELMFCAFGTHSTCSDAECVGGLRQERLPIECSGRNAISMLQ